MVRQTLRPHRVRGLVPPFAMLLPLAGIVTACSGDGAHAPTAITPLRASLVRGTLDT
jgi:hypothetical protein